MGDAQGNKVSVAPVMAKRKADDDLAPGVTAADSTSVPPLQPARTRPDPGSGQWSMDALFYLAGYAAITAAVLSFFGLW